MRNFLAPAHLALTVIILIWDVVLAGRIAQNRQAPRAFQAICGLASLLLLPGVLVHLATSTVMTGRAVAAMDWIWPAVVLLFTVQSLYALSKRLVNWAWGFPIAVYNILIALISVTRYLVAHGWAPAEPLVAILAAQSLAMVFANGTATVMATPFYINMPMVSPAFPALRGLTASFRLFMAVTALMWSVFIIALGVPRAIVQLRNYDAHRSDPLRERPNADFAVGLKMFPDIRKPPSPSAIRGDSALRDTMDVDAISVVVIPGATKLAIDSLGKVVDPARHDSTLLIVAIGYRNKAILKLGAGSLDVQQRLATMKLAIERLKPNIILPAEDPYASGQRAIGTLPPAQWQSFLTEAARIAKATDKNVRVGVSASAFTHNDSALYAWAAAPGSPIDVVGFSLFPSPYVGGGIQADTRTADRWMRAMPPKKEHWIFATGGYPLAFGERSQENAVWEVLAWATDHPAIKGAIIYEAGDYGVARGLRAPNGRTRPVTLRVIKAIQQLRESAR
jgi:hypothetical protein